MKLSLFLLTLPLLAQQNGNVGSLEKERVLGQRLASEIRRQSRPLDNPPVSAYVKRIGDHLAGHLAEQPFVYTFEVISDARSVEPLSVSGGYVLLPARFFLAVQDEAEFAGMLAHAIGHIALRHGTRMAPREHLAAAKGIPLMFMGGWMGSHADSAGFGPELPVAARRFQRAYELEADAFGLELAAQAGYPGAAFRRYLDRTQVADAPLSPLPKREVRLARIDESLRSLPIVQPVSSGEFQQIREAVRDLAGQPQ